MLVRLIFFENGSAIFYSSSECTKVMFMGAYFLFYSLIIIGDSQTFVDFLGILGMHTEKKYSRNNTK